MHCSCIRNMAWLRQSCALAHKKEPGEDSGHRAKTRVVSPCGTMRDYRQYERAYNLTTFQALRREHALHGRRGCSYKHTGGNRPAVRTVAIPES